MNELDKAREIFSRDLYATELTGAVIEEVGENYSRCSMKLTREHQNAFGGIMGGCIYTLADFAFAVASNYERDHLTVSLASNANFLAMSRGSILYAEAKMIKEGRNSCLYEVEVSDDLGKVIAKVSFTGMHIDRKK